MSTLKSNFGITKPDSIECTMELTMTLEAWKVLSKNMSGASDSVYDLKSSIRKLVAQAEKTFSEYSPSSTEQESES